MRFLSTLAKRINMVFHFYVCNYPAHFKKEDVKNLFKDFDGVKVDKVLFNFQNSESSACLTCNDIDQLVSVIKKMNRTSVSGYDLIVRATDKRMQEYVNLILENDETFVLEESFIPRQIKKNNCNPHPERKDSKKLDICDKAGANNMHFSEGSVGTGDNSEKSYMYDKSGANCIYEKKSLNKKDNSGVSEKKSTFPSRSTHNIYQKKYVGDCETSNDSCSSTKFENKLNNQTNSESFNKSYKNTTYSSGNLSNSYQTETGNEENKHSTTKSNSFSKSLQEKNLETAKQTNIVFRENTSLEKKNNCPNPRRDNKSYKNNTISSGYSSNHYRNQSVGEKNELEFFKSNSNHSTKVFHNQNHHQTTTQTTVDFTGNFSHESRNYNRSKSDRNDHGKFKNSINNFSECSYNNTSVIDSQASKTRSTEYFRKQREISSPTWVSVSNFPFDTSVRKLYELFSDYKPLKVKMICNKPQRNRCLIEAHVCFQNSEIADDVILNFDNTLFEGRYILVNDVEDLTIVNELLNISHS